MDSPWLCPCGFRNRATNKLCGGSGSMGCKTPRGQSGSAQEPAAIRGWLCDSCGFSNRASNSVCGGLGSLGCKAPRQRPLPGASSILDVDCADVDSAIPAREPGTMRLVTYNVSFNDCKRAERMSAIAEILRECDPDVIALQELTQPMLEMLLDKLGNDTWQVLQQTPCDWYFTALLLRSDVVVKSMSCKPFDVSHMSRWLQHVVFEMPGLGSLLAATSHLESPQPRVNATEVRQRQFRQALNEISMMKTGRAVWAGDMNWMDDDGAMPLPQGWVDAWSELRDGEGGTTYHANQGQLFAKVCRFDRVLMCGSRPVAVVRLGAKPIDQSSSFPSDHYGLFCVLQD